ncbi:hypothetical protein AB0J42_17650 [Nonomuraea sp. NPDC049649]|uniref:hypothetical protein n=1 Tax=Nonomuraea sp. NPDC049649 TaxID=3155776 RepID=UPI003425934A
MAGTWDGSRLTLTEPPGAAVEGVADEELQRRLDDKYGEGVVRLEAVLKPAG